MFPTAQKVYFRPLRKVSLRPPKGVPKLCKGHKLDTFKTLLGHFLKHFKNTVPAGRKYTFGHPVATGLNVSVQLPNDPDNTGSLHIATIPQFYAKGGPAAGFYVVCHGLCAAFAKFYAAARPSEDLCWQCFVPDRFRDGPV